METDSAKSENFKRIELRVDYLIYFSVIMVFNKKKRDKKVEHNLKDEDYTEAEVQFKPTVFKRKRDPLNSTEY